MFSLKQNIDALRRLNIRQCLEQTVAAGYAIISSYMLWKAFCLFLNNDSPIVCVISESMEPGFKRGDVLFLKPQVYQAGDIAVYQVHKGSIPIVHRVIKRSGDRLLTKGDNNIYDDVSLYKKGRGFLDLEDVRAGIFGYTPYIGMPTIWISSVPGLKMVVLGIAAWSVFMTRN